MPGAPRLRPPPPPRLASRSRSWRALASSFAHAWDGLVETALRQRNMRIHLVAGLLVAALAGAVALPAAHQLALAGCVLLVLAAELANSALEAFVDLATREIHERARIAKDAGAAVVLVLAVGSVIVLALVVEGAWPVLVEARGALLRQGALAAPLAAAAAGLLLPAPRPPWLDALLVGAGCALLVAVASVGGSLPFAGLAALLFAVAAGVARRRTRTDGNS